MGKKWSEYKKIYDDKYPFTYDDLENELYNGYFCKNDNLNKLNDKFDSVCKKNNINNFTIPFVGSNFFEEGSIKALWIGESKYFDVFNENSNYETENNYKLGKEFFNLVLDSMVNGTSVQFSEEIKELINNFKHSIYNQEPIISYIKVRSAVLGVEKRRYRDYGGWPFPFLIRAINKIRGYSGDKKIAELNCLKEIAFVNYFQVPFGVIGKDNGFGVDVFNSLTDKDNPSISWEQYCSYCDKVIDFIIENTKPNVVFFGSKLAWSSYNGKYRNKNDDLIKQITHPACWHLRISTNDREKLEHIIKNILK